MDDSNGTTSSEQIIQDTDLVEKELALELLKKDIIEEKELFTSANRLMNVPILDLNISDSLIGEDTFEILKKDNVNPIFARNLLNIISIVNFIWKASKSNVDLFHRVLLSINIMFAYLFRNINDETKGIDYILLAPVPDKVFDYIIKYGKICFKNPNDYKFDEEYFSPDRNKKQIGIVYEQNSISQIVSFLKGKEQLAPKIMYYLNKEFSSKLYENNIFDSPKNFKSLIYIEDNDFKGYNEIDLAFCVKENITIKQNFMFNTVKEKNEDNLINNFNINNNSDIIFEENTNYFMEMKSNIEKLNIQDILKDIKKKSDRFQIAYKNTAYEKLEKKFIKDNTSYFLLYDNNRNDLISKKFDKNVNDVQINYNSGYVQLSSIVSLQNEIRSINEKVFAQDEKLNIQNEKLIIQNEKINEQDEKLKAQDEKMKWMEQKLKIQELDNKILKFKINSSIKIESVGKFVENIIKKQKAQYCNIFSSINQNYIEMSVMNAEIYSNEIINISDKIIGKILINEEKQNFFKLINLLNIKINEKVFGYEYYSSFQKALIGPNWIKDAKPIQFKMIDVFSKSKISDYLKNIIKCIYFLEKNHEFNIEVEFIQSILYYLEIFSKIDNSYEKAFIVYANSKDLKSTIMKFIEFINIENFDSYINKK